MKKEEKMSRIRQRINQFDINLTLFPDIKEKFLTITETIVNILESSDEDNSYLRELLHHLSVTYNTIIITVKDSQQYVTSETESEKKSSCISTTTSCKKRPQRKSVA